MKSKIIPIVSIIVGIIAFALTSKYLSMERNKLKELEAKIYQGAKKVKVIVAAKTLPQGTVMKKTDLGTKQEFESAVRGHAVTLEDAEMILGKTILFTIEKGEPVSWSHIEGGSAGTMSLAPMIQQGMRAISLSASGAAAVSSMIQPNDRIDVLGTFAFSSKTNPGEMETVTLTILQDVTVLATGQKLAKQDTRKRGSTRSSGYSSVTLEVTPRESELLVFAQQMKGRITLSLRNPKDTSFEKDLPEINFKYLEEKLPELNDFRQKEIRHKRTSR